MVWVALHGREAAYLDIIIEENVKGGCAGCVEWGPRGESGGRGSRRLHCRLCWLDKKGAMEVLDLGGKFLRGSAF